MRTITTLQINRFYDLYQNLNVTFSKDVILALGLKTDQIAVRCNGKHWSCIINSASMKKAKVICGVSPELIDALKENHQNVSLRFAFMTADGKDTVSFYVSSKITHLSTYEAKNHNLIVITLEYTQKAPDDLIEKLGFLLEANTNSTRRKTERLTLNDENIRKIDLVTRDAFVFVQGIPRRCVLVDISFGGVKLILVGIPNFLVGQEATVKFDFDNPQTTIGLKGKIIRAERIEGRKDLIAVVVYFVEEEVPLIFKIHLNKFFSVHKVSREIDKALQEKSQEENRSISKTQVPKENGKTADSLIPAATEGK